jgi:hypothetical protein
MVDSAPARTPRCGPPLWFLLAVAVCASIGAGPPQVSTVACPQPSAETSILPPGVAIDRLTLGRCVLRDLEGGRWADAEARLNTARQSSGRLPDADRRAWQVLIVRLDATRLIDAGAWEVLTDTVLPHEETLPWVGPLVRGTAAARMSWARQDDALQARARAELTRLEQLAREAGPISDEERARLVVQGAMAGAQYEREDMQLLLDGAHDLEVRLLGGDQLRVPVVLAWELEADLLRLTDRYAAAADRYRDQLVERPRRVQAHIGLASAYRQLGFTREAEETLAQARALWAGADAAAAALVVGR